MIHPQMPEQCTISLGASAEKFAGMYGISRQAQDEFALRSHQLAASALLRSRGSSPAGYTVSTPTCSRSRRRRRRQKPWPTPVSVGIRSTSSKATRWGHRAARILGRIAQALRARGGGYGVAAICIGVGQGLAVVLEG